MTPGEQRVSDAVRLALAEVKEEIRQMLDEKLGQFQQQYRACTTCDERHQGVSDRLVKAERMIFWGIAAAITGTLGALFSLAMFIADLALKKGL